jgi:Flp pilus assembly pilin Flp
VRQDDGGQFVVTTNSAPRSPNQLPKPTAPTVEDETIMKRNRLLRKARRQNEGSVFVEYLLLLTLIGIGVIAGLATVRSALINELNDLAQAINAIT